MLPKSIGAQVPAERPTTGQDGSFHHIIEDNVQRAVTALRRLREQAPMNLKVYSLKGPGGRDPQKLVTIWDVLDMCEGDYFLVMSGRDGLTLYNDNIHPGDTLHMRPHLAYESGDIVHASGTDNAGHEFVTVMHIHHEPGSPTVLLWSNNDDGSTCVVSTDQLTVHGVMVGFIHRGRGGLMVGADADG